MPRTVLNGVALHYQRRLDNGPDLVLLHGLAANLAFWYLKLAPQLRRGFRLTMADLRGHGRSSMPSSGYTTADMASDLHALIEHLGMRRAHLVGHSYGGAVALHYAVLHPERVASVTLADARIKALQPRQLVADWPDSEIWKQRLKDFNIPTNDSEIALRLLEVLAKCRMDGGEKSSQPIDFLIPFGVSKTSRRSARRWLRLLGTTTAYRDFTAEAGLTLEKISQVELPVLAIFGEL